MCMCNWMCVCVCVYGSMRECVCVCVSEHSVAYVGGNRQIGYNRL